VAFDISSVSSPFLSLRMTSDINWVDGEDSKAAAAIASVRRDGDATDWMYITFAGTSGPASQKFKFGGSGTGGVNTLSTNFRDNEICFALASITDKIDDSVTIKFAWINWLGENVGTMMKARLSTQLGAIKEFMGQSHLVHNCNNHSEVSDEIIRGKVMSNSGTLSKVLDTGSSQVRTQPVQVESKIERAQSRPITSPVVKPVSLSSAVGSAHDNVGKNTQVRGMGGEKVVSSSTAATGIINFQDEQAILNGIRDVRDDTNLVDWVLITYVAPKSNTLKFHASGEGGLNELLPHLKDDVVMYGLLRQYERIDETEAVKFCFVDWRGDNINRMQRANLGIHSGEVTALFRPYHVDVQCASASEITQEIITKKIKFSAGTAVHVL